MRLRYVPADGTGDYFTGRMDCGPLESMATHSKNFAAATWDERGCYWSVTSNANIASARDQMAHVIIAVTTTSVIQRQIASLVDGCTYIFNFSVRVPSGARKDSLATVDNAYVAHLSGPTQVTLTTSQRCFKITGTPADGQTGLWIPVRQYAANGDDWTAGDIRLWGTCLHSKATILRPHTPALGRATRRTSLPDWRRAQS